MNPFFLAFQYADGVHTYTGRNQYNRTTGRIEDLHVAGSLLAFSEKEERDSWVSEGNGAGRSTGYGPGSKHREAIDFDCLPDGWSIGAAQIWEEDEEPDAVQDAIDELVADAESAAAERIVKKVLDWQPEDGVERLADLLNDIDAEGLDWHEDLGSFDISDVPDGYYHIADRSVPGGMPEWVYAVDADGGCLVLVAGTTDDGWTADSEDLEDLLRKALEREVDEDELDAAVAEKVAEFKAAVAEATALSTHSSANAESMDATPRT